MRGMSSGGGDAMEPSDINEKTQIVGRQIWRVVPYAKRYPGRVLAGIFGNAMARFFDLMPFVAIGLAVDYFTGGLAGPDIIQDFVTSFGGDPAVGYGILIFLGFFFLAIFHDIKTRMRKAVMKVTTIRIIDVEESETTSSNWLTSLDNTAMICPVCRIS